MTEIRRAKGGGEGWSGEGENEREGRPVPDLPSLKRIEFLVLLVLADGESHGYRIVQEIRERTGGRMQPLPGNLYAILRRLADGGMITESTRRPAPDLDDQRRRYYTVTAFGRRVLRAEAELMRSLVQAAAARDLLGDEAV